MDEQKEDLIKNKTNLMNAFSQYVFDGKPFDNDAIANLIIIVFHLTKEREEETTNLKD